MRSCFDRAKKMQVITLYITEIAIGGVGVLFIESTTGSLL